MGEDDSNVVIDKSQSQFEYYTETVFLNFSGAQSPY